MTTAQSRMPVILDKYRAELLAEWLNDLSDGSRDHRRIGESEMSGQMHEFLDLLQAASAGGSVDDMQGQAWTPLLEFLESISHSRAQQGFNSAETATFIFSVKRPLFKHLRKELTGEPQTLADEAWRATELIDKLGLHTVKAFQKAREAIIKRQQDELLELSTPVVKLWEGILALPIIGTLDSARTQIVMESLLQRIGETGAEIAIIDITGVPTVDTLTAQHLLKTVTAIRLMGAECIISGIRPQIAQTIVHLGIDLQDVTTKGTLADALALALKRSGFVVARKQG